MTLPLAGSAVGTARDREPVYLSQRRKSPSMPKRQPRSRRRAHRKHTAKTESVFLNIPYDSQFENLFLAYIAAICAFGFVPRATLEIPFSRRRLDRILDLIEDCRYSVHDLSRVQIDRTPPPTPRFNMPFELGLTVGLDRVRQQGRPYAVFESQRHRIEKSLSDLNGTDVYVHGGTIRGVFRECGSMFVSGSRRATVPQMMAIYRILRAKLRETLLSAGQTSPFNARVFSDLCVQARAAADELVTD